MSAPMVRAILAGTKTQTRRVIRRPLRCPGWTAYRYFGPSKNDPTCRSMAIECGPDYPDDASDQVPCPFGAAGDRLWVREAWRTVVEADATKPRDLDAAYRFWYEAGAPHQPGFGKLRPSMFMPRFATRLLLDITGVRVERLQSISPGDAIAEGLKAITKDGRLTKHGIPDRDGLPGTDNDGWPWHLWRISPVDAYEALWESINGPGSWDANPFVWVVSFTRVGG